MTNSSDFWPAGVEGAVSLTFDDNAQSQFDHVLPCLDDRGLKSISTSIPGAYLSGRKTCRAGNGPVTISHYAPILFARAL